MSWEVESKSERIIVTAAFDQVRSASSSQFPLEEIAERHWSKWVKECYRLMRAASILLINGPLFRAKLERQ